MDRLLHVLTLPQVPTSASYCSAQHRDPRVPGWEEAMGLAARGHGFREVDKLHWATTESGFPSWDPSNMWPCMEKHPYSSLRECSSAMVCKSVLEYLCTAQRQSGSERDAFKAGLKPTAGFPPRSKNKAAEAEHGPAGCLGSTLPQPAASPGAVAAQRDHKTRPKWATA